MACCSEFILGGCWGEPNISVEVFPEVKRLGVVAPNIGDLLAVFEKREEVPGVPPKEDPVFKPPPKREGVLGVAPKAGPLFKPPNVEVPAKGEVEALVPPKGEAWLGVPPNGEVFVFVNGEA